MQLQWAWALPALLVVPLLIAQYLRAEARRTTAARRYASPGLIHEAVGNGPGRLRHVPPALYLVSLTLLLIAAMRPTAVVTVPAQEGTVILALDISGSMQAQDVDPSRISAAKTAARRFVERQRDHDKLRIGIVAFSDVAYIVQIPTTDRDAAIAAISRLTTQRGTAIGRGILASLDALVQDPSGALPSDDFFAQASTNTGPTRTPGGTRVFAPETIVLLTDGVNTQPPTPLAVLDGAIDRGVRVYTIGLGTQAGASIAGFGGGRRINARLDEGTLKTIAESTDGEYFNASSAADLTRIYDQLGTQVVFRTSRTEISVAFLALATALALAGATFSLVYFNRIP